MRRKFVKIVAVMAVVKFFVFTPFTDPLTDAVSVWNFMKAAGSWAQTVNLRQAFEKIQAKFLQERPDNTAFRAVGEYHAVIIAVDDSGAVSSQHLSIQEAENLIEALTMGYTFKMENVHFLKNPSPEAILEELSGLKVQLTSVDSLLLCYSGPSGWDDVAQLGYWRAGKPGDNDIRGRLSNRAIRDAIRELDTRHTLLIADACFMGTVFQERPTFAKLDLSVQKTYDMPSRKAMAISEVTSDKNRGVFLRLLVKHLAKNQAQYLYATKLFLNMRPDVVNRDRVVPMYGTILDAGNRGGDFVFIRK